ncbi:MAG: voltage-gated potassium channel [Motiliproteus sp.]
MAGTDSDSRNLEIIMSAAVFNPDIFMVVRQNHHENEIVFNAAWVNLTMQPSLLTPRTILLQLISPLIPQFLEHLRCSEPRLTARIVEPLHPVLTNKPPLLWLKKLTDADAIAFKEQLDKGRVLRLKDLIKSPANLNESLSCVPLVLQREGSLWMMPSSEEVMKLGDVILFCGDHRSQGLLDANLNNPYTLDYLITGTEPPKGYLLRWL